MQQYAYRNAAARELSGGDVLQTVVAQRDSLHRRPELYLEEGVAQPGEELSGRLLVEAEREHGRPRLPPARPGDSCGCPLLPGSPPRPPRAYLPS